MDSLRTKAVIHLDRLTDNLNNVKSRLPEGCGIIAVVKGDAYGHGIAGIYPTLRDFGIKHYAVAVWEEAKALRDAGATDETILILGDVTDAAREKLFEYGITATVYDAGEAEELNSLAAGKGVTLPVHIKIDTGLSRIGFPAGEACLEPVKRIAAMKNLKITGAFTHFMNADDTSDPKTLQQFNAFRDTVAMLRDNGVAIPFIHCTNSAALMNFPETFLDAVRVGDVLFGLKGVDDETWNRSGFKEVMTWDSYVSMVKTIKAGTDVSYGSTYTASEDTVVATVSAGFADGYGKRLSNCGTVYINGSKAPVIGKVCMDQFMVDVTDIPGVKRGDRVELLGEGFGIADMAELIHADVDEIVCGITKRVPKIYE